MKAIDFATALMGILPAWRRFNSASPALPVWRFLRQRGGTLGQREALQAEMRCELCDAKPRCARADSPAPGCPNSELLQER